MTYVDFPDDDSRELSFYLDMEEWLARHVADRGDLFFMWQVDPTVIIGRNQVLENEVNIGYCREHGIHIYRRKSGGGCVFADRSNVMLSYITHGDGPVKTFPCYLTMIVNALRSLGIGATWTEHNDIMVGDRKISGNAYYHITRPEASIVHGTLLYDTDMAFMTNAITPPRQKLERHGVESVRQRIGLLKDYTPLTLDEIKRRLRLMLTTSTLTLRHADLPVLPSHPDLSQSN